MCACVRVGSCTCMYIMAINLQAAVLYSRYTQNYIFKCKLAFSVTGTNKPAIELKPTFKGPLAGDQNTANADPDYFQIT